MQIDPVLSLTEDIRATDASLIEASRQNEICYSRERAEEINRLLSRLKALYMALLETVPTSALGAGELLRMVVQRMPVSHTDCTAHLGRIADRLCAGRRLHGDLVWLRALADTFLNGPDGNTRLGTLIAHAVHGAALPVLVFRAVTPPVRRVPDLRDLMAGPR